MTLNMFIRLVEISLKDFVSMENNVFFFFIKNKNICLKISMLKYFLFIFQYELINNILLRF